MDREESRKAKGEMVDRVDVVVEEVAIECGLLSAENTEERLVLRYSRG